MASYVHRNVVKQWPDTVALSQLGMAGGMDGNNGW
jgi:hypothetical protein